MAIQLSLYSNDSNATEYTDTNSNVESISIPLTHTLQIQDNMTQVRFRLCSTMRCKSGGGYEYHADLTPWVTESWDSSNSQNVYGLSTAPITGGVSATYLYAEDYQGNQISSLSDFSRVHNVYYSIETEQVDSMETTISVDFSSNTATFGTETLYTFQGTDATGGTSGYWTDSATELYLGASNPYEYARDGSMGEDIMTQSRGVHILGPNTLLDTSRRRLWSGWYSESYPISEWLGSDSISPQLVMMVHRVLVITSIEGQVVILGIFPLFSLCRGWYLWGRLVSFIMLGRLGLAIIQMTAI